MFRRSQPIPKVCGFVLLSLVACRGLAAQAPPAAAATLRQPRPVEGIEDPYQWSPPASPAAMVTLRAAIVYAAGRDLWASDGTTAGTRLLATLCHGYCHEVVALGHTEDVAFFAERIYGDFTRERIVRTDGTAAGTFYVTADHGIGYYQSFCPPAAMVGERLYFGVVYPHNSSYCELWSSDGTTLGTARLAPDALVEGARDLVPLGDQIYFLGLSPAGNGLLRASAQSGRVELVRAFRQQGRNTRPARLIAEGRRLFFFGPGPSPRLWTSDGTARGTVPVTRFGVASGPGALLAGLGGRAWFVADDGHGEELWSSDGSVAGTRPVTDFSDPHPFEAAPLTAETLALLGARMVFPARHEGNLRLWSTSADMSAAQLLIGCLDGCPVVAPLPFAVVGNRAVLVGRNPAGRAELWVTDGSGPGTQRLRSARAFAGLVAVGGGVLFLERDEDGLFVGKTNGTPAGTAGRLAAADPARENLAGAVAAFGGRLFFPALDPGGSGALWAVWPGGTAADEVFLPPPHAAQPGDAPGFTFETSLSLLGRAGGRVLAWKCDEGQGLYATDSWHMEHLLDPDDGRRGCEDVEAVAAGEGAVVRVIAYSDALGDSMVHWATDGTRAGTSRIPVSTWYTSKPVPLADRALFTEGGFAEHLLWRSDGTAAGTGIVVELPWGSGEMTSDGRNACFFQLFRGSFSSILGQQLWCSDGTPRGTRTVGPVLSAPRLQYMDGGLALLAGRVYFCGTDDSRRGWSLFAIGEGGIAAEIRPEAPRIESCRYPIGAAAGRIWFYARPTRDGEPTSLWASDGTATGTVRVAELAGEGSDPIPLGDVVIFVAARHGGGRRGLWRSDGTASGTGPLFEIGGDLNVAPVPVDPVVAGGRLWFAGIDRQHGIELWSTDGTADGTRLETDLAPGPAWSNVRSLVPVGDKLYFVADDGERSGIWVIDLD